MLKITTILFMINLCFSAESPFDRNREEPYTYAEIIESFLPIVHEEVQDEFKLYTKPFFHEKFGKTPHGKKGLIDCWNCYYESMRSIFNSDNTIKLQRREIFSRMAGHSKALLRACPDTYDQLLLLEQEISESFQEDYKTWLPHVKQ